MSGQRALAMRGSFEMVIVDATGRPTEMAAVTISPSTEESVS